MNDNVSSTDEEAAMTAVAASPQSVVTPVDWRELANRRLARLVELEHDHSCLRDRMSRLQADYRELLRADGEHLQRLYELERRIEMVSAETAQSARFWFGVRLSATSAKALVKAVLRRLVHAPVIGTVLKALAPLSPAFSARVRTALFPNNGNR